MKIVHWKTFRPRIRLKPIPVLLSTDKVKLLYSDPMCTDLSIQKELLLSMMALSCDDDGKMGIKSHGNIKSRLSTLDNDGRLF